MADLAHNRLRETLYEIAQSPTTEPGADDFDYTSAILDAWSIVDSVHRLRGLLYQVPGLKQNTPALLLFMKKTVEIDNLRNAVQHLNQQIHKIVDLDIPVWGALSWAAMLDPEHKSIWSCTLVAGAWFQRKDSLMNPLGKMFYPPVDLITLDASGCSVCLSEVMRNVEPLVRSLEAILNKQFNDQSLVLRDSLICAEILFQKDSSEGDVST